MALRKNGKGLSRRGGGGGLQKFYCQCGGGEAGKEIG